jgi:hypothetical protein
MTPGPTIVLKCSACGDQIAQPTIGSGNTFGARFWTDGKREAPMLPDDLWLVTCPHCGALVWIDELEQVGEMEPWEAGDENPAQFPDARSYETPTMRDYLTTLEMGVSGTEKEYYLRLRAWWAGNDQRRYGMEAAPMSSVETDNLRAYALLLDGTEENDRLMKAEAMRELGLFEEAKALLTEPFSDEVSHAVAMIRELTEKRITAVREMDFG